MNLSFPPSIMGARCDVLMDIVTFSMAIILSLLKFGAKNPRPGKFSKTHKFWGKLGMWDMALICTTGLILYVFGFLL